MRRSVLWYTRDVKDSHLLVFYILPFIIGDNLTASLFRITCIGNGLAVVVLSGVASRLTGLSFKLATCLAH